MLKLRVEPMARKVSVDLLKSYQGELGIWKQRKTKDSDDATFETLLNFNFEIEAKVVLGSTRGSGTIYRILIPGEGVK